MERFCFDGRSRYNTPPFEGPIHSSLKIPIKRSNVLVSSAQIFVSLRLSCTPRSFGVESYDLACLCAAFGPLKIYKIYTGTYSVFIYRKPYYEPFSRSSSLRSYHRHHLEGTRSLTEYPTPRKCEVYWQPARRNMRAAARIQQSIDP